METDYLLFLDEFKNNNKVNQERNKDYSYNRYFFVNYPKRIKWASDYLIKQTIFVIRYKVYCI